VGDAAPVARTRAWGLCRQTAETGVVLGRLSEFQAIIPYKYDEDGLGFEGVTLPEVSHDRGGEWRRDRAPSERSFAAISCRTGRF